MHNWYKSIQKYLDVQQLFTYTQHGLNLALLY